MARRVIHVMVEEHARRQQLLVELLTPPGAWTNRRLLAEELGMSPPVAGIVLEHAAYANLIGQVAGGSRTRWYLAERVADEKLKYLAWARDASLRRGERKRLLKGARRSDLPSTPDEQAAIDDAIEQWLASKPTQRTVSAQSVKFVKRGPASVFDFARMHND